MTSAFPKPCGRLDWHAEHEWVGTHGPYDDHPDPFASQPTTRDYRCIGRVLTEGGYWADWDAADEQREEVL